MSKKLRSMVIFLAILITIGSILVLLRQTTDEIDKDLVGGSRDQNLTATQTSDSNGHALTSDSAPFDARGFEGSREKVTREKSIPATEDGTIARKPWAFSSVDLDSSVPGILETISKEQGWSEKTLIENKALWDTACDTLKDYADSAMNAQELGRIEARMFMYKRLEALCKNLADEVELAALDSFAGDSASENAIRRQTIADIESALRLSSHEDALRLAGSAISTALSMGDEALVHNIASLLAFDDDVLDPFIRSELNYVPAYRNVISEVASTLICEWSGGCTGRSHPYVLRQCVDRALGTGAYCHRPENIQQAIYQTLTPIEFAAYQSFLNQVYASMRDS